MKSIGLVKGELVPKQVQTINESKAIGSAGRMEPGVEVEKPAESFVSTAMHRKRATDKDRLSI